MKRTQDKIKDFVEPQALDEVQNYVNDPPRALAAYRFTDATSDLLARWVDALADLPRHRGAARALAGVRGVGKSHTLAAFGALAAHPALRPTVPDAHVATSAHRLLNRRYVVARVQRGTHPTLEEEISIAFAAAFNADPQDWVGPPSALLRRAAQTADAPLVVIIDTAFDRASRVQRDDGPVLGELARASQSVSAFLALALDDDIAGADGANVALAGTFQIDYLDPEHLYRIVDLHLFQKNAQARAALHDIYTGLREDVPGFNWSEPRFASLYPLHPLIADIAAAVRLHAPTFALLSFASLAGAHAANRPALSLIVLDEVFDRAEYDLRKAADLKDAFAVYDKLAAETVGRLPIMQRHQAKLVLKGLFILSLDGRGATAREVGAAMLIYDKSAPDAGIERINDILATFAAGAPPDSLQQSEDKAETRYRFTITASADLDLALAERSAHDTIAPDVVSNLLRTIGRTRFEDWPFRDEAGRGSEPIDFTVMWRGMGRRGRITWGAREERGGINVDQSPGEASPPAGDTVRYDWEIVTLAPRPAMNAVSDDQRIPAAVDDALKAALPAAVWKTADLSEKEIESLRRLVALRTDATLFDEFGEKARAAERTYAALAERIWARVYLDDATLVTSQGARPFTDEARAAKTLAEAMARMLAPLLGARYPQHPVFTEALGENEVARLVGDLFSGANQGEPGVQELARLFAAPLGLASSRGGIYALEAGDQALKQPWVREVLALTDAADGDVVPLDVVYRKLKGEPYGLLRDVQYLILAALVAGRRVELITSNGDRISRRTLDHKLKWDEISGVARAATLFHSAAELTQWARLLTNRQSLASIADHEARETVRGALDEWLEAWRGRGLLEKLDALPDEGLTTRTWNMAASVRKSFGAAADAAEAALSDIISLEEGLQRVADAFGDSAEQFGRNTEQLTQITTFAFGLEGRERARRYLLLAEPAGVDEIESARRELLAITKDVHNLLNCESNARFDRLWPEFHARYSEHYAKAHDETIGVLSDLRPIDELTRGEGWRNFESLCRLSIVNGSYWEEATRLLRQARDAQCDLPVRQLLVERPACGCSFRLARAVSPAQVAQALEEIVTRGLEAHRRSLALWGRHLAHALSSLVDQETSPEKNKCVEALAARFAQGNLPAHLAPSEVELIERALQKTVPPPLRVVLPREGYGLMTRDELGARLKQWLDDLPNYPALVDVVGENSSDAN